MEVLNWNASVTQTLRREALKSASDRASREAERIGRLLSEAKLSGPAQTHLIELQTAHIHAAEALMAEASQ